MANPRASAMQEIEMQMRDARIRRLAGLGLTGWKCHEHCPHAAASFYGPTLEAACEAAPVASFWPHIYAIMAVRQAEVTIP